MAKEQLIPKQIMRVLDEELQEEFKTTAPLYSFIPIKVEFLDQQADVLKKPHWQYEFPKGGGSVDITIPCADGNPVYIKPETGSIDVDFFFEMLN